MTEANDRAALVTGANSGLGFEASAQLAEQGYHRVVLSARTAEKAATARDQLSARTGEDVFETLVLDSDDLATVESAANELAERGGRSTCYSSTLAWRQPWTWSELNKGSKARWHPR